MAADFHPLRPQFDGHLDWRSVLVDIHDTGGNYQDEDEEEIGVIAQEAQVPVFDGEEREEDADQHEDSGQNIPGPAAFNLLEFRYLPADIFVFFVFHMFDNASDILYSNCTIKMEKTIPRKGCFGEVAERLKAAGC